jgi:uncharacterized radical SAM superfamily Fe-S cluster-containing enzyme
MNAILSIETVLKETTSRCPVCNKPKPAKVIKVMRGGREQIVMRRECPCHGISEFTIATDARFYHLAQGSSANRPSEGCGCGTACSAGTGGKPAFLGSNALDEDKNGIIEKLSTCLALIEVVESCNMACPTCFADSPVGAAGQSLKYKSFENITAHVQGVIDRKGHIELLQLSGGEPTLHPDIFRIVEWVRSNPGIDYLIINTNGIRFAKDEKFLAEMGRLYKRFDNIQLYLQFDGPQQSGQVELRGADMRKIRDQAIRNCQTIGLPITLAMTVNQLNLGNLWETVAFGSAFDHVRGVSFQPEFISGRNPTQSIDPKSLPQPITVADIILGLNEQSSGLMPIDDFTPLPCGDPNCATIGWIFRMGGQLISPSKHGIDIPELQRKLPDRMNYNIEDLRRCGCENTVLGDLMKSLELKESNAFRLFIKPFMDARTWDQDRIKRCCTHVIGPDGRLHSFCEYYGGGSKESTCC